MNTNIYWGAYSDIHGSSKAEPTLRITSHEQTDSMVRAVAELPPKEQDILTRSFGLGNQPKESYELIGHSYGVTKERIRQIRKDALAKLRYSDALQSLDV